MNRVALVVLCVSALFVAGPCRERVGRFDEPRRCVARSRRATVLAIGKKAYRQFCGQCHALKEARAVGFGSAKQKGVGEDGGPSFNQLKVSYQMCLASVTMLFGGHEKVDSQDDLAADQGRLEVRPVRDADASDRRQVLGRLTPVRAADDVDIVRLLQPSGAASSL